jgi:hypothetical protein
MKEKLWKYYFSCMLYWAHAPELSNIEGITEASWELI